MFLILLLHVANMKKGQNLIYDTNNSLRSQSVCLKDFNITMKIKFLYIFFNVA